MKFAQLLGGVTFAVAAATLAAPAAAQSYPTRPVTIVVPFAPGGPTDIVARSLGQAMEKSLGGTVVVENKPGAGGTLAVADVARAPADGYRVLVHHIGMSTAPALYRKLPFDPLKDFEYIGLINAVPMTLLVRPGLPVNSVKELAAYVKANRDKVTLANAGLGAASHLCGLLFQQAIATDLTTVPYKGTAPAMADLLGGQVDILCDQTTQTTPQILSGKLRALAITSPRRIETLKDVPTAAEAGLPGFELSVWHGMYAPKGTPKPVVDKIVASMQAALKDPDLVKRFTDLGSVIESPERQTPDALSRYLKSEIDKWAPIIKKAGEYAD
ncbi:MAG: tripartite tricarboxylate transporter substrate binding protein BugD [Burkholderiales bacterium]|jgi:tripartite-type tricarboxylate transporter receptor subunit TctC|nr:tripartite tricarboxylate transporter substrate binding protein BugD [Burkholderiales bacterium]